MAYYMEQGACSKPKYRQYISNIRCRVCSIYKTYRVYKERYKNQKRRFHAWLAPKLPWNRVKPPLDGLNRQKRDIEIIVSLTTFPARVETVCLVLKQMLSQTLKPDRVLLYLAEDEFPGGKLPAWADRFRSAGVDFIFCKDLKPHKKYYFAMQQFPDAIVITVDDDARYSNDLVEVLYKSFLKFPHAISALRTHEITFSEDGHILPYSMWDQCCSKYIGEPRMRLFATGVAGVLYPPHCLHPEVFNERNLTETCLLADDLWLKVMSVLNGTPVVLAKTQGRLSLIMGTQNTTLGYQNVTGNKNDVQLKMILERYNDFLGEEDSVEKRIRCGL